MYHFGRLTDIELQLVVTFYGPVIVGVSAGNSAFMDYEGGIFNGCLPNATVDHSVLLVGFTSAGDYIIKNSWGTDWGENGYMTIKNSNDCGLKSDVFLHIVGTLEFDPIGGTPEYTNLTIEMKSSSPNGYEGYVFGIVQDGVLVSTFGENFTTGFEATTQVEVREEVQIKIIEVTAGTGNAILDYEVFDNNAILIHRNRRIFNMTY